jgi:hypothetical protein
VCVLDEQCVKLRVLYVTHEVETWQIQQKQQLRFPLVIQHDKNNRRSLTSQKFFCSLIDLFLQETRNTKLFSLILNWVRDRIIFSYRSSAIALLFCRALIELRAHSVGAPIHVMKTFCSPIRFKFAVGSVLWILLKTRTFINFTSRKNLWTLPIIKTQWYIYMPHTFNIGKSCTFPTECNYVFLITVNSDCFQKETLTVLFM